MQQNSTLETLIGACVVAVAAGFLFFAYRSTGTGSLSGYEITAKMGKVDGISPGTDVRINGIKVGTVTSLTLDPRIYNVVVHMSINPDIKIPEDSSIAPNQPGLIGTPYLSILPGGSDKMMAAGGQFKTSNSASSIDLNGLIGNMVGQGGGQPPK